MNPSQQLEGTKFLKSTGIFDAYEHVINQMILSGWPSDKSVFEHAAYELLKWASEHKDEYRGIVGRSIEKRSDLIFASRDNIPELGEYRKSQDYEKYAIDTESKPFGLGQKFQIKSRKHYNLTQNKLDISIFEFKDRPLFRKRDGTLAETTKKESVTMGEVKLQTTKPSKSSMAKVDDTSFQVNRYDEQDEKQEVDIDRSRINASKYLHQASIKKQSMTPAGDESINMREDDQERREESGINIGQEPGEELGKQQEEKQVDLDQYEDPIVKGENDEEVRVGEDEV